MLVLRAHTGETLDLDLRRWHAPADDEERQVLTSVEGPVIDLGCGPGRLVVSLASRGVPALGVDSSPAAVALARQRGAAVLERDLFGRLPGEGRWATALLFDGNVGIGGDPARLLSRCRELTGGRGRVVAEVRPPGRGWRRFTAWFERDGERSEPFAWAEVGADAIAGLARAAGLELAALVQTASGRWFARLEPTEP
ncbi:MAG TPA: class I SAM-dependent methyltransferase [Acidimicrobiales bacterium]|nr:class I SAM-dependent methyltransferase [Acidimicrobiales bacterium]